MMIPKKFLPKTKPYAAIAVLDPDESRYVGAIQDPWGTDVSTLTGITFHQGNLYLGSLHNDYIAVYDLQKGD